jgi:chlorite dismutase
MTPAPPAAAETRHAVFAGGDTGAWRIMHIQAPTGDVLAPALRLDVAAADTRVDGVASRWLLTGTTSNDRYVERAEKAALQAVQAGLGRPAARWAALIPIRKNAAWWAMTQDERRDVFEARSHHIGIGMRVLPAVARRLYHCRDLPGRQAFDFLTWFEFEPEHVGAFDELLHSLRATPEWQYVDREVDIRLVRDGG